MTTAISALIFVTYTSLCVASLNTFNRSLVIANSDLSTLWTSRSGYVNSISLFFFVDEPALAEQTKKALQSGMSHRQRAWQRRSWRGNKGFFHSGWRAESARSTTYHYFTKTRCLVTCSQTRHRRIAGASPPGAQGRQGVINHNILIIKVGRPPSRSAGSGGGH